VALEEEVMPERVKVDLPRLRRWARSDGVMKSLM
jgi:hypothetical protein